MNGSSAINNRENWMIDMVVLWLGIVRLTVEQSPAALTVPPEADRWEDSLAKYN